MRIAPALFLVFSASAQAADCVNYADRVTLIGRLTRHTFPEEPNYESIERGDAAATYFFVSPDKAICVAEGNNRDGLEPAEPSVRRVQLVFLDAEKSYRRLRPQIGKEVTCEGHLYHEHTGHHHSRVLLADAKCRPTHSSTGRANSRAPVN